MEILRGRTVILKTVEYNDIEQIRKIRNSEEIGRHFIFREKITPQQQVDWFHRISESKDDYFFSIYLENKLIGLTEIKKINWKQRTGEGGIFIIPEYQNSYNSFETSILSLDYAFNRLKLKKILSTVMKSNKRAIKYNKVFGFKEYDKYEQIIDDKKEEIVLLEVTVDNYIKSRQKISNLLGI